MYVLLQKRDQLTAFIYNHLMSESLPLSGVVQRITIFPISKYPHEWFNDS